MYFSKRLAFIVVLSSWLSYTTAAVCFFHDEEKAFKKIHDLIDKMHPDNHQQVYHALTIAYKGIQIGIASFRKNIQKKLIKYRKSTPLPRQLRIRFSDSFSPTHGILYIELYTCAAVADNKINMFYVSQNSAFLYAKLTIHDKHIFEEIFNYFMVQKYKNKYILPLHFGQYSYIRNNTV